MITENRGSWYTGKQTNNLKSCPSCKLGVNQPCIAIFLNRIATRPNLLSAPKGYKNDESNTKKMRFNMHGKYFSRVIAHRTKC